MPPVCAFCRKRPVDPACPPFCSRRCRLQDLACWVDGRYTIPGEPLPDSEDGDSPDRKSQKD
ncbi:MAG: DNA gyrase inhibitor YacG [Acidobacteriota bacterium]